MREYITSLYTVARVAILLAIPLLNIACYKEQCGKAQLVKKDVDNLRINIGYALSDARFRKDFRSWLTDRMSPRLAHHESFIRHHVEAGSIGEKDGRSLLSGLKTLRASIAKFSNDSSKENEGVLARSLEAALKAIDVDIAPAGARLLARACDTAVELPQHGKGSETVLTEDRRKGSGGMENAPQLTYEILRQLYFPGLVR